jgi:hypothetical protein
MLAALLIAGWIGLALVLEAFTAAAQPVFQAPSEGVLITFDADGGRHESRLAVVEDGTGIWVQSGHFLRGWYERLLANPEVELVRGGETRRYRAVPIDTPESEAHVTMLLKRRAGPARYYVIRALLLFADIKPVRLDPR